MFKQESSTGFTQMAKQNIAKCDGCACQCDIVAHPVHDARTNCVKFRPMIGGQIITKYFNKYGEEVTLLPCVEQYKCMDLAFQIASLCDYYKTR